jgi:hypothetical protein
MSSKGMNMNRQEVIAQELLEIVTPERTQLRFDPEDERELQESVREASFLLAEEDDDSAVADANLLDAKNALVYFVSSLEENSSLGFEGQEIWVDREDFRIQVKFLPCPPFCKPR